MADCTRISENNDRMPVYSPIVFVVDSTDKMKCRFKYVAQVYVSTNTWGGVISPNAGTFNHVATMKEFPDPNGRGVFDVHRILESYVGHDVFPGVIGGDGHPHSYVWYQVDFGVEFDDSVDCSGEVASYDALDTFTGMAWNGGFQYDQFPKFTGSTDVADVFEIDDAQARFLTDHPSTGVTVMPDSTYQLSFLNYGNGVENTDGLGIVFYHNNTFIGNGLISTANPYPQVAGDDIITVGVGPYNLSSVTTFTDTITRYDVFIVDELELRISEALRFNIDWSCSKHDPMPLTWLNRLGGFDSFTFTGKSTRSVPIKRTQYDKNYGSYYDSSWGWGAASTGPGGDRGRTILSVKGNDKWKLSTGWITEAEGIWMEQLFTSPQVFRVVVDPDAGSPNVARLASAVNVISNTYEEKKVVNQKMISYTIEIESAVDKTIQRG